MAETERTSQATYLKALTSYKSKEFNPGANFLGLSSDCIEHNERRGQLIHASFDRFTGLTRMYTERRTNGKGQPYRIVD